MKTIIVQGKAIARRIATKTTKEVAALMATGITPTLGVVLVGDDKSSRTYIKKKQQLAEQVGMRFQLYHFSKDTPQNTILSAMKKAQKQDGLTGLIVQLPLPSHLDQSSILNAVEPRYDVDGLTDVRSGQLLMGTNTLMPPTPGAIIEILDTYNVDVTGKTITIIGMGALVGKPLALLLVNRQASVITCDSMTPDIKKKTRMSDIVITGVGKADLLTKDMIKKGTVVIDAGIDFIGKKMVGDVAFAQVQKKSSLITPTPGGVGPITVAKLIENTVLLAKQS